MILEKLWSIFSTNLGTKTVSIVIAVVLWVVVLGSRSVEATKEIPLEIITPADIVPSNEIPDRITFRFSGPKAFLRAILDRREEPIRVNLSDAKPGLVTYRFFSDNIRVPIGVKVLAINPTALLIKLEYLKRREVLVKPILQGSPPEGYRIVNTTVKPEYVRVKGAESRVDAISEISTIPVDVSELRQSIEREVALDLNRNTLQIESALPKISITVEPVSANFKIKNVDVRVISLYKTKIEEKNVTVLVRAESNDLRSLDKSQVYAVVDMTGKEKGKYLEPVKVTLPKNIGLVKIIPSHLNVTLY